MKDFVLQYEELKKMTLSQFVSVTKKTKGVLLKDLKVRDLSFYNGQYIYPGEGVYVFKNGTELYHIGKCSSMSFTERLPKHFDVRKRAWFNRLLEITVQNNEHYSDDDEGYMAASAFVFDTLELVLINFHERERISAIERLLRATNEPLNKFKRLRISDSTILVENYHL